MTERRVRTILTFFVSERVLWDFVPTDCPDPRTDEGVENTSKVSRDTKVRQLEEDIVQRTVEKKEVGRGVEGVRVS